jgi:hypothetical protein
VRRAETEELGTAVELRALPILATLVAGPPRLGLIQTPAQALCQPGRLRGAIAWPALPHTENVARRIAKRGHPEIPLWIRRLDHGPTVGRNLHERVVHAVRVVYRNVQVGDPGPPEDA